MSYITSFGLLGKTFKNRARKSRPKTDEFARMAAFPDTKLISRSASIAFIKTMYNVSSWFATECADGMLDVYTDKRDGKKYHLVGDIKRKMTELFNMSNEEIVNLMNVAKKGGEA